MRSLGWTILAYALLVFLGGIFGYVKAGSTASLVMGVAFAVALSISAFALLNEKKMGFAIGLITTLLLTAFFLYRFTVTLNFMPAGLMSLLSLATLTILFLKKPKLTDSSSKPKPL
jgi:uncharacterized membrane protein (UPF0136 family)